MNQKSIVDKISNALSPVIRKLQDYKTGLLLGTEIKVLRIDMSKPDAMGEYKETVNSAIIDNVIINHPFGGQVEIFENYKDQLEQINTTAIDIWDVLPITMQTLFNPELKDRAQSVKRKDIIVEKLKDEFGNNIPIIYQVEKTFGAFFVKNMVARHYELSLYRGILNKTIQYQIDLFLKEE